MFRSAVALSSEENANFIGRSRWFLWFSDLGRTFQRVPRIYADVSRPDRWSIPQLGRPKNLAILNRPIPIFV